jgi:apolipoprotein D and lipocalin family protein
MNIRFILVICVFTTMLQSGIVPDASASDNPGSENVRLVTTVGTVDLERYVGLWHEIAKIPNRFQKQCVSGTTAEYTLREDGRITVVNRCVKEDGSVDDAKGIAKIVDTHSNAKLKVSFVSFLSWRPFWGDYWVLGLEEGYKWAVIGTPDRKYGWILAREPALDEETMEKIFVVIEQNGYRRDAFDMSSQ